MSVVRQWNHERWPNQNFGIIVLNQHLNDLQIKILTRLWDVARIRVAVDGGCNRLLRQLPHLTPDLLTGDLDSVEPEVLREFEDRGAEIVRTPDQDLTDFTKCLAVIAKRNKDLRTLIAFCATAGRLDHVMANINTLYKSGDFIAADVILHGGSELSWVLRAGAHLIATPKPAARITPYCGLIPVGGPAVVTSKGLKWNLSSTKLAFKELVSTSNVILGDEVFIDTSTDILWTMMLASDDQ